MTTLHIATDFSPYMSGRSDEDGPFNGRAFRERYLKPLLAAATPENRLHIVLDGLKQMEPSFIEEAFGGLIRQDGYTAEQLQSLMTVSGSLPVFGIYSQLISRMIRQVKADE